MRSTTQPAGPHAKGPFIVLPFGAELPARCVRCNAPSDGQPVTQTLRWTYASDRQQGWLLSAIPFVGAVARELYLYPRTKTATVRFGLCRRHKLVRWSGWLTSAILFVAAVLVPYLTFTLRTMNPLPLLAGVALFAVGAVSLVRATRTLTARQIDAGQVTISGACPAYVQMLPADSSVAAALAAARAPVLRQPRPGASVASSRNNPRPGSATGGGD